MTADLFLGAEMGPISIARHSSLRSPRIFKSSCSDRALLIAAMIFSGFGMVSKQRVSCYLTPSFFSRIFTKAIFNISTCLFLFFLSSLSC